VIGRVFDGPTALLTRHFFQGFFRLSFLDDAGEESFKRAIAGALAGVVAFGLFLSRLYIRKYAGLSADLYHVMLPADQLLMISVSMFTVAVVMALVSHSVFPDESDFWILVPLPISRRVIFSAKAAALFLFAAIFVAGSSVGTGVPFALVSSGRWTHDSLATRIVVQVAVGSLGSVCAAATIVAVQGVIVVVTPRMWLRRISVVTQTAFIGALVLTLPILNRLPALAGYLHTRPRALYLMPPAWFLGLQQWLLGERDPYFSRLAGAAILGTVAVCAIGTICFLVVYRRFDRVVLRTAAPISRSTLKLRAPIARHPAWTAVQGFTAATLRRSGLHQLVFVGLFAIGLALAVNRLLAGSAGRERFYVNAVLQAPLTLIAAAVLGLRASLLLPANLRAAWIFGVTENSASRRHQLDAVRHIVLVLCVVLPAALAFPVQAAVLGVSGAVACLPVVVFLGWIFVDIAFAGWRRIPFTCTFLFAKRPPAYSLLVAFLAFGVFGTVGTGMLAAARTGLRPWLVVMAILTATNGVLRWQRLQTWGRLDLEFEDYLPDRVETLGLQ
jgi:hypothetical protein